MLPCLERLSEASDTLDFDANVWATSMDVEMIFRLFLGRRIEPHQSLDGPMRRKLDDVLLQVLGSAEFHDHTQQRVFLASMSLPSPEAAELQELGVWAVDRLPLSAKAKQVAGRAESRQMLLFAILSDRVLWATLGRTFVTEDGHFRTVPVNIQIMIVEAAMLFEHDGYLSNYINVAASGGHPLYHYLHHGVEEGTNPNRMFDTRWYLSSYPNVRREPVSPLVHYILVGAALGYKSHPLLPDLSNMSAAAALSTPLGNYLNSLGVSRESEVRPSRYDAHKATQTNYMQLQLAELQAHIETMVLRPVFLVYDPSGEADLSGQIYCDFLMATTLPALRILFEQVHRNRPIGVVWIEQGDVLADNALYEFAAQFNAEPGLNLVYADEEIRAPGGRSRPFHKPAWSPDYLESCHYVGSASCVFGRSAISLLEEAGGHYDWILRATDASSCRVAHIRKVLLATQRDLELPEPGKSAQEVAALRNRFARTGRHGMPKPIEQDALAYHSNIVLEHEPLVSIVMPTAAKTVNYEGQRIDLLVNCLTSIDAMTAYDNLEYIIVDNGDFDRARVESVVTRPIHFLTYAEEEVNIARKINMGGEKAAGDYILILNDDIVPLEPEWISRMVGHLQKAHVGLVGARLLYPNGLVQHSGMVSCDGIPVHVDRFAVGGESGYFFGRVVARNFLAVTGAVTMVSKHVFDQIGGYDETFPIDFNDVDFAYRVGAQGYKIVYEPGAALIHYESVSAIKPPRPWDRDNFDKRWAHIAVDPYYNEYCLTKHSATSKIAYSEKRH